MEQDSLMLYQTYGGANISFWLITLLVLISGGIAALSTNIVRAAFSLFFTLFGLAGYFVLLGSDFIAVTQIIVYVGGILVLLIFGVLLTNKQKQPLESPRSWPLFVFATVCLIALTAVMVYCACVFPSPAINQNYVAINTAYTLGRMLSGSYVIIFELAAVFLLLGLIGAAFLVRRAD
ncbi:MAG: NADH-quinone oxidoreductase subunit J [Deltaproteobacteria bacterium]|nr:NADH-quinone oxidoreductase subunit J [Deltaproteobacteria bacterium]